MMSIIGKSLAVAVGVFLIFLGLTIFLIYLGAATGYLRFGQ